MKDGYRLDGSSIKVNWATNKGINKDRMLKSYWNVEVGCTYVPWSELEALGSIDFTKWAEGGLVDEASIPDTYAALYKKQMLQLANSDNTKACKNSEQAATKPLTTVHDMELDTDGEESNEAVQQQPPPPPPPPGPPVDLQQHILNHLRSTQPPLPPLPPPLPTQPHTPHSLLESMAHLGTLGHHSQQPPPPPIQFLSHPHVQNIQSAISHFQQMNAQHTQQAQFNNLVNNGNNPSRNLILFIFKISF